MTLKTQLFSQKYDLVSHILMFIRYPQNNSTKYKFEEEVVVGIREKVRKETIDLGKMPQSIYYL